MNKEINFHPWRNNVLDFVGQPLVQIATGQQVMVAQNMRGQFMIYVAGALVEDGLDNIGASSVLNRMGCSVPT